MIVRAPPGGIDSSSTVVALTVRQNCLTKTDDNHGPSHRTINTSSGYYKRKKNPGTPSAPIWKMRVPFIFIISFPTSTSSSHCEYDMNSSWIPRGFLAIKFFFRHVQYTKMFYCSYCLKLALSERPVHVLPAFLFRVSHSLFIYFLNADIYFTAHFPVSFRFLSFYLHTNSSNTTATVLTAKTAATLVFPDTFFLMYEPKRIKRA